MKHKTTAIRLLGGLLMAVALLPWVSGTAAQAATTDDPRAVAYDGNAQTGDCTVGGLSGSDITSKVTATDDGTYLDITAVAAGYSVTGGLLGGTVTPQTYQWLIPAGPSLPLSGPRRSSQGGVAERPR